MKRSKIFLGATTALLAIAGVAAAKHYSGSKTAFYISSGGNYCLSAPAQPCTQTGSTDCKYTTSHNAQVLTFTAGPGPVGTLICNKKIRYNGVAN